MNDELRNILGPELFDELSELSKDLPATDFDRFDVLSEDQIEEIANTTFMVQTPMSGSFILQMIASLMHAHETDCETCWAELNMFTINFVGTMIHTMMDDMQGFEDE